jgi:hypothetical protein
MAMKNMLLGGALAVALLGIAGAAAAATTDAKAQSSCFRTSDWQGWRAPDDKTLYLRVNMHDIYKVDLSSGSSMLTGMDTHLVNVVRGSNYVCSPLDLQLSVVDNTIPGMRDFLIAKTITKLTPEQAAAIPKKYQP